MRMDIQERSRQLPASAKSVLAPLHAANDGIPLRLCVMVRAESEPDASPFVLLRELPGARVYLGAVCDAEARIQEWVEVWVQSLDLRDLTFSNYQEQLANDTFDQRWLAEYQMYKESLPEAVLVTGMEVKHPSPVLIKKAPAKGGAALAPVEITAWQICRDDALLESVGLPPYSSSPYRYLHDPAAKNSKTFFSTADDAPANEHVQSIKQLTSAPDVRAVFNPHAGLVRVNRFHPLPLEDYLQILEGRAWEGIGPEGTRFLPGSIYAELQAWSTNPKGIPFLLHGAMNPAEKLNEIFFLKLALFRDMFKEVRSYVKAQQLPLLNLTPASFNVGLGKTGDQFPALWAAKCHLVKPGQAHPLQFKTTAQRYFIRLGRIEPSPFLPEGLGAHSLGIGSVRLRNVLTEDDGLVLEGTLVAEDYLALDTHDLLWFKLPLAEERLEFYAHVHTAEAVGPKEARFRTVPARLAEPLVASLKRAAGSVFQKSPYEIWPLLSSPCDLYSLGIMGIRMLLANSTSNLPVIVDEILSLSRHLGKEPAEDNNLLPKLTALVEQEEKLLDLVSPHSLIEREGSPAEARAQMAMGLWLETISVLLRLFPAAGAHSYCQSFGDVSPVALETVFDQPLQELETLLLRLRSVVAPSLATNEEIAGVILQQLAKS
jgi:hypothetical protein